ncbi:hypothetical protein GCM10020218_099370 [Dactylosporangium vinaceum]
MTSISQIRCGTTGGQTLSPSAVTENAPFANVSFHATAQLLGRPTGGGAGGDGVVEGRGRARGPGRRRLRQQAHRRAAAEAPGGEADHQDQPDDAGEDAGQGQTAAALRVHRVPGAGGGRWLPRSAHHLVQVRSIVAERVGVRAAHQLPGHVMLGHAHSPP